MTAHIVVDLGYGDSGKGTTVDWLCRQRTVVESVVRFNGGPQAGHNVVLPDGRHHQFSQFGAGSFVGVPTFLSRYMAVDPIRLAAEAIGLQRIGVKEPYDLLSVDAESLIVTPYHAVAQRRTELLRGEERHGSCGTGFGEAVQNELNNADLTLRMSDLGSSVGMKKLGLLLDFYHDVYGAHFLHGMKSGGSVPPLDALWETYSAAHERLAVVDGAQHLKGLLDGGGDVVFEGAQGVLLDQWAGFHPHTTWSTTTFENATWMLDEVAYDGETNHVGVTRSYTTRHGPGPFVTEIPSLALPEPHNEFNPWQREFRQGHFDAEAIRYALDVCGGIDTLMITHLDRTKELGLFASGYREGHEKVQIPRIANAHDLDDRERVTKWLETVTVEYDAYDEGGSRAARIGYALGLEPDQLITSWGPTHRDKTRSLEEHP